MAHKLSRRRFISITASAAGLGLLPAGAATKAAVQTVTWEGQALGASASLTIHHHDRATAGLLVKQAVVEVARLERIFSLYRADSALSELNRMGALATPPPELVALLEKSRVVWELSGGAFDPTVQPLWTLLARHFGGANPDPAGPPEAKLREFLDLVGFGNVLFSDDRIAFARRGMALTLNGIAQGFITDRIVDMLRRGGVTKSLVDMGEIRATGSRPDGGPWKVGVERAPGDAGLFTILEIEDNAVATSSPDGFRFNDRSRFSHLIDPRSGLGASLYLGVTVLAPDATTADAFSTAFSLLQPDAVRRIVAEWPGLRARLLENSASGQLVEFGRG
jgi:thiamine biosynthesis lipoprotein